MMDSDYRIAPYSDPNFHHQKKIIAYFKFYSKKDIVCVRVAGNVLHELPRLANHIKPPRFYCISTTMDSFL
jgi:hypothetical protein